MKRLEKVRLQDLTFLTENSDHWRFICPFCPKEDPDRKGKLYIHKIKKIGFCFRCETSVVADGCASFINKKSSPLEELIKVKRFSIECFEPIMNYWMAREGLDRPARYIEGRGIRLETADFYQVRKAYDPDRVVFVNRIFNDMTTDFVQFRYIDQSEDGRRFYIPQGCKRELCWTDKLRKNIDTIILVEGFFSALSVAEHTSLSVDVLVSVGKHLSLYQILKMKSLNLSNKELCLFCEPDLTLEHVVGTLRKIKQNCIIGKVSLIVSNKGDPNDMTKDDFEKAFNDRIDVSCRSEYYEKKLSGLLRSEKEKLKAHKKQQNIEALKSFSVLPPSSTSI